MVITKDNKSNPGAYSKFGNVDTPQLFEIISDLVSPENFHSTSSLSNPADHSQAYKMSPNHSAFTGMIFASGAMPLILNFFVSL